MKISVLTENTPGINYLAEHGLSYLVEHDGVKILFDTGQSDLFINNGFKMGITLDGDPGIIVLSHGHFDHGDGLENLTGGKLICHPGCFSRRYRSSDRGYIGLKLNHDEIASRFDLTESVKPIWISDKIIFLGEIPRLTDFESKTTTFELEDGSPDYVMDDSGIAIVTDKGLFIITGCGHAGVVNTIEHAKMVTGENRIYGIMGGFHLKMVDKQSIETINYLKKESVQMIYPSHCTALPALSEFYRNFQIRQVKTGDIFNF